MNFEALPTIISKLQRSRLIEDNLKLDFAETKLEVLFCHVFYVLKFFSSEKISKIDEN